MEDFKKLKETDEAIIMSELLAKAKELKIFPLFMVLTVCFFTYFKLYLQWGAPYFVISEPENRTK